MSPNRLLAEYYPEPAASNSCLETVELFANLIARTRRAHVLDHLPLGRHSKDAGGLGRQKDLSVILMADLDRLEEYRGDRVVPSEKLLDDRLQRDQVTSCSHVVDKKYVIALGEGEKNCECE